LIDEMIGVKMAIVDWHITTARPHDVRRYVASNDDPVPRCQLHTKWTESMT